jgi:nicotinamide phosphoribosyltransferase
MYQKLNPNLILDTDSYKASMGGYQYPPNTTGMYSHFESRGGRYGQVLFFGLQYLLKEYLEGSVVTPGDVDEAQEFFEAHGEPFNYDGWMRIVKHHEGKLPIRIKAVPEGTLVPTHNIMMSVESTDPEVFWVVTWLETMLVRTWFPCTVASQSWHIKKRIFEYLSETANNPQAEILFKLHDFGSRGVSSRESAGIGGMAHLVNFQGSDTIEGIRFANHYYNHKMAGYSIPASEHSTICAWGRENEVDAFRNMVQQFAKPGKIVACVSDSYDIWNSVENLWGDELRDEVKNSGGTLVIRPDSGNPPEVVLKCLQILERKVGMEKNLRGYKVLPDYFRLIQGDGVNEDSIAEILSVMKTHGYSASNIAFGCGGALLQKLNRDTQKFAYKCSEITVNGQPREVFKDPITDKGKKSKAGRLSLVLKDGQFTTVQGEAKEDQLVTVFENGEVLKETTLDEVRKRAERSLF